MSYLPNLNGLSQAIEVAAIRSPAIRPAAIRPAAIRHLLLKYLLLKLAWVYPCDSRAQVFMN